MSTESVAPASVSCAEVRAQLEVLGLPVPWLAAEWGVSEGTVRNWMKGTSVLPAWVIADVAKMRAHTDDQLNQLVASVKPEDPVVFSTYRNDREYNHAVATDNLPAYCAQWHRTLCARAQRRIPSATIEYRYARGQVPVDA